MAPMKVCYFALLLILVCVTGQNSEDECLVDGTCTKDQWEETMVDDNLPCTDEEEECEYWAGLEPSECDVNQEYMHMFCRKACGVCTPPLDIGVPQNMAGERSQEVNEVMKKTLEYMKNVVMVDPKYKEVKHACKNKEETCSLWALRGECEKDPRYMIENCAPACQICEKLIYEERCPFDPEMKGAWEPGDLNDMFENITTHDSFSKYQPRILSSPTQRKDDSSGPWVIILENFVSHDESEKLIQLGHTQGYERSTEYGEMHVDGTFENEVNEARTSTNAWCLEECYDDPVTRRVLKRIEHVTGISENNTEYMQLLRYEPGQYYNLHHDYIEFDLKRPQGVRMMTLYIYLNDVEDGGGTRFPGLDLTVMPKRGRALLWPSVLDEDPSRIDARTEHQALPVTQGIKYGANVWIHQRDFKTPDSEGCS